MKTTIIVLVLLLLVVPAASADSLYCNILDDVHVYHFDVSVHTLDGFIDNDLPDKQGFNYLEITNFVKVGPSTKLPGYTEYKVMNVDFLKDDIQYRISVIAANSKHDFRDAPKVGKWIYGHTGVSNPLFVNVIQPVQPADELQILEVR